MNGSLSYPLSQRIQDTVRVHGWHWTLHYYLSLGLPRWQFCILAGKGEGLGVGEPQEGA